MQREVYIHSLLERGELTKACVVQYEKISNSPVLWQKICFVVQYKDASAGILS